MKQSIINLEEMMKPGGLELTRAEQPNLELTKGGPSGHLELTKGGPSQLELTTNHMSRLEMQSLNLTRLQLFLPSLKRKVYVSIYS